MLQRITDSSQSGASGHSQALMDHREGKTTLQRQPTTTRKQTAVSQDNRLSGRLVHIQYNVPCFVLPAKYPKRRLETGKMYEPERSSPAHSPS
jgi:hypothetical protein